MQGWMQERGWLTGTRRSPLFLPFILRGPHFSFWYTILLSHSRILLIFKNTLESLLCHSRILSNSLEECKSVQCSTWQYSLLEHQCNWMYWIYCNAVQCHKDHPITVQLISLYYTKCMVLPNGRGGRGVCFNAVRYNWWSQGMQDTALWKKPHSGITQTPVIWKSWIWNRSNMLQMKLSSENFLAIRVMQIFLTLFWHLCREGYQW